MLSPMLFIIVMSVLMTDAVNALSPKAKRAFNTGDLADLCSSFKCRQRTSKNSWQLSVQQVNDTDLNCTQASCS